MIDKIKTKDQKMREEIGIILEEHGLQWKYDFTGALVDSLFKEISKTREEMGEALRMEQKKKRKPVSPWDVERFYRDEGYNNAVIEQSNKIRDYLKK